jgi:ribose 1,5-bisphosphokinase
LRYGLPVEIEAHLADGKAAVVKGSRGAQGVVRQVFPSAVAVEIRIDQETLARRLENKGCESGAEIGERLARAAALQRSPKAAHLIDDSAAARPAGDQLVRPIREAFAKSRSGRT